MWVRRTIGFACAVGLGFLTGCGSSGATSASPTSDASAAFASLARAVPASADRYLKLDGIEGESTAKGFERQIEVLSFSWGVSQSSSTAGGGGGGAGKVSFQDFHFVKEIDKSSPVLFQSTVSGNRIKNGMLSFVRSGGGPRAVVLYQIELKEILIGLLQQDSASDTVPTEQISLNFDQITLRYFPANQDGSVGAPIEATYDASTRQYR